jgi:hypothetical protein
MTEIIELKFERTNVFTRWPCTVCGGCTEKVAVLVEAKDSINGGDDLRVCEECLKRDDIDGELGRHADRLEADAQELRRLIGHLKVPTFAEWRAECERADAEVPTYAEWRAERGRADAEWRAECAAAPQSRTPQSLKPWQAAQGRERA